MDGVNTVKMKYLDIKELIMFKLQYDKITWALLITLVACLVIDVVFQTYDITTWAFTFAFIAIGLCAKKNV